MRRILALDTSTWWGGAALVQQDDAAARPSTVAEIGVEVSDSQAIRLFRWIDLLLEQAGWSKTSLDGFVAVRGPGSFTGIRVALGVVRGLAVASGRPCAGIDTLEAMAEAHGPCDVDRIPLLGAGRGEVYGARFDPASSPPRRLREPWLGAADRIGEDGTAPGVLICGPGAQGPASRFNAAGGRHRRIAAPPSIAAAAGRLALLGGAMTAGEVQRLSPLYLRPPDAEAKAAARRR